MTRKLLHAHFTLIAVALLVLTATIPARADDLDVGYVNAADNESPGLWFVELTTAPTSEGVSATTVASSKDAFRSAAKAKRVTYKERYAYGDLWNGLSVSATATSINSILRVPGVARVWPVVNMALPDPGPDAGETIDLATAIHMTGADYVQDTLGFTGKGINVAVMDTGIDYDNPDLGGCFGPSCRVFTGWDFVGDAYNADSSSVLYNPTPAPDAFPDDCNGHGTHVSGIVGANGVVKGVAPDVRFGAYRVFGCEGSTTSDIMLAAMERALADRMDVLNMSIGSAFTWPQYPTAVGADRLVRKHGIAVVASIGNSGANGLYSAGAPGLGEKVIGVASFDNTRISLQAIQVSGLATPIGYTPATAAPPAPTSGTLELKTLGTTTTADDGCAAMPAGTYTGKAALIRRGTCGFAIKAANAQAAGAAAVILYNNQPGQVTPTVAGAVTITIPVVMLSQVDGNAVWARLNSTPGTTLTWTAQTVSSANPTAGLISSFSSYGLSPDLSLKPDIGAPGGSIWSTLPLERGGHGSLSGTSMASPHVAGAVALLLQALPKAVKDLGLDGIRGFLQNTAEPALWWGNPGLGFLDNVQRQGAGMLNIRAAIEATAAVTPGKLALGESVPTGTQTRTLTITDLKGPKANNDDKSVTYTFGHEAALAIGPDTFMPGFFFGPATVSFSAESVTVKKNKSATVDVTITAPTGLPDRSTYGGYIVIKSNDGEVIYRVPYSGFKGDYQSIQVLTNIGGGFFGANPGRSTRQLGYSQSTTTAGVIVSSYGSIPTGYVFAMGDKPNASTADCPSCGFGTAVYPTFVDVPNYLLHLNHQAQSATFRVYDAAGTTLVGEAFTQEFLPRNSTATSFFAFPWDGFVGPAGAQTAVAAGTYTMKVTVRKALGGPADIETFTFGAVTIAAPPAP
jgi:subtilisin family serine protease